MTQMPDHCHFVYLEDGTTVHIPGCWATVHGDRQACTCHIKGSDIEQTEAALLDAQRRIEDLHRANALLSKNNTQMHIRNTEMRRRIMELKQDAG